MAFGVLAMLLTTKLRRFESLYDAQKPMVSLTIESHSTPPSLKIFNLILEFLGYNFKHPQESIINNPLAYRTLLVDLGVWRNSSSVVQKVYYDQFTTFSLHSKYHHFNTKRLSRMSKKPSRNPLHLR